MSKTSPKLIAPAETCRRKRNGEKYVEKHFFENGIRSLVSGSNATSTYSSDAGSG